MPERKFPLAPTEPYCVDEKYNEAIRTGKPLPRTINTLREATSLNRTDFIRSVLTISFPEQLQYKFSIDIYEVINSDNVIRVCNSNKIDKDKSLALITAIAEVLYHGGYGDPTTQGELIDKFKQTYQTILFKALDEEQNKDNRYSTRVQHQHGVRKVGVKPMTSNRLQKILEHSLKSEGIRSH